MACPCKLTSAAMAAMGCPHAAYMHAHPDATWTDSDRLIHLDEEDAHFFPIVRRAELGGLIPRGSVEDLQRDHYKIRTLIGLGMPVPDDFWKAHAQKEDAIVMVLSSYGVDFAKWAA